MIHRSFSTVLGGSMQGLLLVAAVLFFIVAFTPTHVYSIGNDELSDDPGLEDPGTSDPAPSDPPPRDPPPRNDPPPATATASITANPGSIVAGSATQLSWNSANVTTCSISNGVGTVNPNTAGATSVSPVQTTTYVITCTTGTASTGSTWQYDGTDISDFSCPLTQNSSAYNNVPDCPSNPQGKSCNAGTNDTCKINYSNQSTCNIETTIYTCEPTGGSASTGNVSSAVTVTVTQIPDLVGQVGGAVTASTNQPVTLYGGVANQGAGAAGYFPNLIQVCDANCATVNQVLAATAVNSLSPGGWQQVSASYTPASTGAQFYRVCANNNTSWVNVHTESNYGNNCSGWQNLTVASNILSVSCVASPDDTLTNESVTWEAFINNPGGTSSGQTWQSTGSGYTKVCSGGSNTTAFQNTCAEGVSNGTSCEASQVGTRCKVAQDQDACAADGGTVYGSVQSYRCTANSTNAPTYTYSWSGTDGLSGTSKQVARSYSTVGSKQGTVMVQGSDGRSGSATCQAIVSAPADLTAGSVSPTAATAGSPATLSATASNIGNGASGSFPMLFQVSETGALFNSGYIGGLASGASAPGSASYTFPSAGSYQVRACANFNTAWTAITTESNYGNNCGPWTTVTVAAAPTPALSCSVSSSSVSPGQSVTYNANPSGGASGPYTWTAADGGSYGTGSTANRSFSTPGTYAMNVSGSNAGVSYCPNVIVAASWCMNRPTELTITATPNRLRAGQSTTLTWTAAGVNGENASCSVSGPGVSWSSMVTGVPACSASGSANPTISTQSTYTLTCAGVSKSVTVNVIPNFQEF